VIEIKNLLFQPLTLHLAGDGRGLHLNPREIRSIGDDDLSSEIEAAAKRGLVSLSGGSSPPEQEGGGKPKPKRRKRR